MRPLHPIDLGVHNLTCDKICFPSRKIAKRAARTHHGEHKTPYQCADHWHIGKLLPSVLKGRKTRGQVYRRR
jgi:hypothetical protein